MSFAYWAKRYTGARRVDDDGRGRAGAAGAGTGRPPAERRLSRRARLAASRRRRRGPARHNRRMADKVIAVADHRYRASAPLHPGAPRRAHRRAARRAAAAAARPAHLGHRPLQLPLQLLHAEGGVRQRLRLPAAVVAAELRGDRARRRACSSRTACSKIRLTGGEPLLRRDLERLVGMLAELRSADGDAARPHADDQRLDPRAQGGGAEGGRARPRHGQPRRARRRASSGA